MRIAIAGAAGFIGLFLARSLERRGATVVPLGRADPLPEDHFDAVVDANGDSRRFWANENPHESFQANVLSVSERMDRIRCGTYLYLSTIDVYGSRRGDKAENHEHASIDGLELETYGLHKWMAERIVLRQAERPLILRLGTVIGPGLKKNPVFDACNGGIIRQTPYSTLSLIDLATVEAVVWRLLDGGEWGIFNATSRESVTVQRALELVTGTTGRSEYEYDDALLTTDYAINVDRLAALMPLPTAEEVLQGYLAWTDGRGPS